MYKDTIKKLVIINKRSLISDNLKTELDISSKTFSEVLYLITLYSEKGYECYIKQITEDEVIEYKIEKV